VVLFNSYVSLPEAKNYPDPSTTVPQRSRIGPLFDGPPDQSQIFPRDCVDQTAHANLGSQRGVFRPAGSLISWKIPSKMWMTGGSQYFFLKRSIFVGEIGANWWKSAWRLGSLHGGIFTSDLDLQKLKQSRWIFRCHVGLPVGYADDINSIMKSNNPGWNPPWHQHFPWEKVWFSHSIRSIPEKQTCCPN
jgi:hypothetical protein